MEAFAIFIGLAFLALSVLAPILALVGLVRGSRTAQRIEGLESRLDQLETRLSALTKTLAADRKRPAETPAEAVPAAPPPAEAPTAKAPPSPTPPAAVPAVPAPVEHVARVPAPARVAPPVAAAVTPPPAVANQPPAPAALPRPAVPTSRATPPPPRPPSPPSRPAPPSPPAPSFDWESLLGLKGAAWLGGIAIVIAGLFLVKLAYDRGLFTPELRLASLLAGGVLALVWAELSLRRGYATTANAVSGAAVALLYIAFYGGHALWHLFPTGVAFFGMVVVTVLAGVVAVRYDAVFTAVLGLLGGFATPVLLSTGEDRPFGLFGYILLLNLGLLAVAARRGWHALTLLGLAGTFVIEVGWLIRFLTPEKTAIGLGAFLMFGLLYLWLPSLTGDEGDETLRGVAAAGAAVPFLFAIVVASRRAFAGEWPLLFGYLALLEAALAAVALLRGRVGLLLAGAASTAVALPLWALQGVGPAPQWGPLFAAIGLAAIPNLLPRLARLRDPRTHRGLASWYEAAGVVAAVGLGFFSLVLALAGPAEPPWPFLVLIAALLGLLVARSGEDRLAGVWLAGSAALAILVQIWFLRVTSGETVLQNLGLPLLLAALLSLVAGRRSRAPVDADEDDAGVVAAIGIALLGLFGCLVDPERGADLRPLFAGLVVLLVLVLVSALRRDWTPLVPASLAASALFLASWQASFFHPDDVAEFLPACAGLYLAFLLLPFVVRGWRTRPLPWLSSALAGPAFFFPLYRAASRGWGETWIGLLPVAMAAATVAALARVSAVFAARPADAAASRRRLRFLALFAAVALGFVALAIPLQLEKQWITVGWALETAAVWWLFGKLPHPGLKYLGALLYAFVGARLLFNWSNVLRYQDRGLPIVNWILYTYGVPALCCLVGAWLLRRAEEERRGAPDDDVLPGDRKHLAPAASLLGLVLVFVLINLEIVDYFSSSRRLELEMARHLARDLAMSVAWGVYAMVLLLVGLVRRLRALRIVSLVFLLLTVAKVFLYDLSQLTGLHRVLSFLGLGAALIVVSLLYQRFVLSSKERS